MRKPGSGPGSMKRLMDSNPPAVAGRKSPVGLVKEHGDCKLRPEPGGG
jgi:hypothetical protein